MTHGQARSYRDGDAHSWAVGRYAVAELLALRPELALEVAWDGRLAREVREPIVAAAAAAGVAAARNDARVRRARRKGSAHVVARFDARALERDLAAESDHVVWIAPDHFGNVGTTIRSLRAFGLADLALIEPRLPPAHPHVVRASIGAIFGVRVRRYRDLASYRAAHERRIYTLHPSGDRDVAEVDFARPCSVLLGPERTPRTDDALPGSDRVRIAQDASVESLNVAVAAGIALHALARRRGSARPRDGQERTRLAEARRAGESRC